MVKASDYRLLNFYFSVVVKKTKKLPGRGVNWLSPFFGMCSSLRSALLSHIRLPQKSRCMCPWESLLRIFQASC